MKKRAKKKHRQPRASITIIFTFIVMCEILATVAIAAAVSSIFGIVSDIPFLIQIWLISLVIGCLISAFVNARILYPIKRLNSAMSQVTKGNFDVTLDKPGKILEIKNIYESFNLMTRELSATEILQTDFVSNVSHEIKTPISAIEGYATLLQSEDGLSESGREYTEKILFNTRRLSELVGNILLLSRLENTAIETKSTSFRLDEQIRRAVMLLEPKWTEKQTQLDIDLQEVTFTGNDGLLFHVWTNLIDNAIKFSPVEGAVNMRLYKNDDGVIFTVEDSGEGIPPEAQQHVFDKFYQGDGSHKQDGNGLGLALAKKILIAHRGDIQVENLSQGGCRFTVCLPED